MKINIKEFNLTWTKLIIFAIIIGIYTGVTALIPAFQDTSFRDISISFEWWILFGILIILNSKSNKDSALKCFVFFLISQPLVYLVQVIFGAGWGIFRYYSTWFIWTLLTLPMGYIGYYIKKDNLLGLAIITPILVFLGIHLFSFMKETINFFPNHLLSSIFCIITMFIYVYCIFSKKKERIIGTIICAVIILTCLVINLMPSVQKDSTYSTIILSSSEELYFDNTFKVYLEDESYGQIYIKEEDFDGDMVPCLEGEFRKKGKTNIYLESNTEKYIFEIEIGRNTYSLKRAN